MSLPEFVRIQSFLLYVLNLDMFYQFYSSFLYVKTNYKHNTSAFSVGVLCFFFFFESPQ